MQRWPLLFPVFIGVGIASYFSLHQEPRLSGVLAFSGITIALCLCLICLVTHLISRANSLLFGKKYVLSWSLLLIKMLLCCAIGFTAAKIRTDLVNTPRFADVFGAQANRVFKLSGFIEEIEDVPRGSTQHPKTVRGIVLSNIVLHSNKIPTRNVKIRVQAPKNQIAEIQPFTTIKLEAQLFPPQKSVSPHGYKPGFDAFFKGVTAFGKVKKILKTTPRAVSIDLVPENKGGGVFMEKIKNMRLTIKQELAKRLSPEVFPIASALTIGEKPISIRTRENYTNAGISHILAISGLHMGLLAFLVFFVLSELLVFVPGLAERFSVKKMAASLTIPASLFYLLFSGSSFSAMRAFLMVSISMVAILIDERPISLRNVAIAAIIILILFPESLFSASFQLSFSSVAGLCAYYEKHGFAFKKHENFAINVLRVVKYAIHQNLLATCIATIFTMPITIYTFQRITLCGFLGNLLAIPLLSWFIMPVGILAVLSLLFCGALGKGCAGDGWWLHSIFSLFQSGIKLLNFVVEKVSSLPYSNCPASKPPLICILLIVAATLLLIVWGKRKGLKGGVACFIAAGYFFFQAEPTRLFFSNNVAGLAGSDGVFYISDKIRGGFLAKVWSQEQGLQQIEEMPHFWKDQLLRVFGAEVAELKEGEFIFVAQRRSKREVAEKKLKLLLLCGDYFANKEKYFNVTKLAEVSGSRPWL
jgi:competence protein ComEC